MCIRDRTNGAQPTVETNCSQLTVETTPPGKKRAGECLSEDTPKTGYGQPSTVKGVRATNRKKWPAEYYIKNRERILEYNRNYRRANRERISERMSKYHRVNLSLIHI